MQFLIFLAIRFYNKAPFGRHSRDTDLDFQYVSEVNGKTERNGSKYVSCNEFPGLI